MTTGPGVDTDTRVIAAGLAANVAVVGPATLTATGRAAPHRYAIAPPDVWTPFALLPHVDYIDDPDRRPGCGFIGGRISSIAPTLPPGTIPPQVNIGVELRALPATGEEILRELRAQAGLWFAPGALFARAAWTDTFVATWLDRLRQNGAEADVIAFILPRTLRKFSIQNRLNRDFHLLHEEILPDHAFLFRSQPYDVPTVFQIWERRPEQRRLRHPEIKHPDFEFTTPAHADFAIQRVGARAGRVHHDFTASRSSHYFIRGDVEAVMAQLDFICFTGDVAGNPSLAKSEIVYLYREWIEHRAAAQTS